MLFDQSASKSSQLFLRVLHILCWPADYLRMKISFVSEYYILKEAGADVGFVNITGFDLLMPSLVNHAEFDSWLLVWTIILLSSERWCLVNKPEGWKSAPFPLQPIKCLHRRKKTEKKTMQIKNNEVCDFFTFYKFASLHWLPTL